MCSTTNKTCFIRRIPRWKQCIGSVEESRWLPGREQQWVGTEDVEVLLCLQDGLWVGLALLHAGLSLRSTQHSGTVPVELWGVRRALQMNPMEGEAFSLRGHSALFRLAGSGAGTICVQEAALQALQEHGFAHTSIKLIHVSCVEVKVCPPSWACPSRWVWKHQRDQFRKRNS